MQSRSAEREARRWQYAIAAVFLGLGGWCLVAPQSVIDLTILPEHRADTLLARVSIGAFGAQAMLAGLIAATSRFTHRTFAALGLAVLPFFVFDWWFWSARPLFNHLILLDVLGNLVLVAVCARGWWLVRPAT